MFKSVKIFVNLQPASWGASNSPPKTFVSSASSVHLPSLPSSKKSGRAGGPELRCPLQSSLPLDGKDQAWAVGIQPTGIPPGRGELFPHAESPAKREGREGGRASQARGSLSAHRRDWKQENEPQEAPARPVSLRGWALLPVLPLDLGGFKGSHLQGIREETLLWALCVLGGSGVLLPVLPRLGHLGKEDPQLHC